MQNLTVCCKRYKARTSVAQTNAHSGTDRRFRLLVYDISQMVRDRPSKSKTLLESHVAYWMALISMTLSDLECQFIYLKPYLTFLRKYYTLTNTCLHRNHKVYMACYFEKITISSQWFDQSTRNFALMNTFITPIGRATNRQTDRYRERN